MTKCYFCKKIATCLNKDGMSCCRECSKKVAIEKCPLCGDELQKSKGKFGAFFKCYFCGVNFSESKLSKYKER